MYVARIWCGFGTFATDVAINPTQFAAEISWANGGFHDGYFEPTYEKSVEALMVFKKDDPLSIDEVLYD